MGNISKKQLGALIGAMLLMFAFGLANSTIGFFVRPVTEDLKFARAAFTMYYTIMALVGVAMAPIIGRMLQSLRMRVIILLGCVWGTLGLLAFSRASELWMFYVIGGMMGLFQTGCTLTAAVVIINRWFPRKNGAQLGLTMAGTGLSSIVMSMVLPGFLDAFGWRAGYLLQAGGWFVLVLLAAVLAGGKPEAQEQSGAGDEGAAPGESSGLTFKKTIRSPQLYFFMLCIFSISLVTSFLQHMPAYFADKGISTSSISLIMTLFSLFLTLCKIGHGSIYDRIGPRKTVQLFLTVFALSFWIMHGENTVFLLTGAALMACGMTSSTVMPPLLTKKLFGLREFPAIWSVASMSLSLGGAMGSPFWGTVYDKSGSYDLAIIAVPVLILLTAASLSFLISEKRQLY